jgi:Ca-activated chloride channel family protein
VPDLSIEFVRPLWLLGLLPLLVCAWWLRQQKLSASSWEHIVDPALQPHVLEPGSYKRYNGTWWLLLGWLLTLITLAGPVWQEQEKPLFQAQPAQVVLFDLSASMVADDIKPSRLVRGRFKLIDLLKNADGVQVALIAFTERPYVVSPLTADANTIEAFVESLDPAIMPVQGSRIDLAIEKSLELFEQANVQQGHIVLITDSEVGARDFNAATVAKDAGHKLSVIGVGTERGAPLRADDGRFVQSASGSVVVPQLQTGALKSLARTGGGIYSDISTGLQDINALKRVLASFELVEDATEQELTQKYWVEFGSYAVLGLLIVALLLFRRGVMW